MPKRWMTLLVSVMLACNPEGGTTEVVGDAAIPADSLDGFGSDAVFFPDTQLEILQDLLLDGAPGDALADGSPDLPPDGLEPTCAPGEGCFLDPCDGNETCQSGYCVQHMGEGVCSKLCNEDCPTGWTCKQVDGVDPIFLCVSDFASLCRPCADGAGCQATGTEDVCVDYGGEGSFCGGACEADGDCPWGFFCAAAQTVAGVATLQCMAEAGVCPCTDRSVELGLWTPCTVDNEAGSCAGMRICTEDGLSECDAPAASEELCDGIDNDCDELVDEPLEVAGDFINLCDDGNDCTTDACLGEDGCAHEAVDGGECVDGDPCTAGDHCEVGLCVGAPVVCDDQDPCTDDDCDNLGGCVFSFNDATCDDGDPCTYGEFCSEGACSGGQALPCDCQSDADCAALEDGDLCNGTLICDLGALPYQCVVDPDTVVSCPDPGAGPDAVCLQAACDPASGVCGLAPDHEGLACSDGDACSLGEVCTDGLCTGGVTMACNDGNPCTDDGCDPDSGCVFAPNTAPCNDGSLCTDGDICGGGFCGGTPTICEDDNQCTDDGCDPATGCVFSVNEESCDDGDLCTVGDHCHLGTCIGGGNLPCDDANPCTTDSCQPMTGCVHDQVACPALPCGAELCDPATGDCVLIPVVCDDQDPCTVDACDPGQDACVFAPLSCDDGNLCTDDSCQNGSCDHAANTAACDDGNACTVEDTCGGKQCIGGLMLDCDDDDPCTDDSCDPLSGCAHAANIAPCDDGDECTTNDLCAGGACVGGAAPDCDDGNGCTTDSCAPDTGCFNDPVADDTPCPNGTCQTGECVMACTPGSQQFDSTGAIQLFTVPTCTSVTIQAWGGRGGNGWNQDVSTTRGYGGFGGMTQATVPVTPGEVLYVFVGSAGEDGASNQWGQGGWNGGGNGSINYNYTGGGGGGASDVRRGGTELSHRILAAGGGGAGSGWCTSGDGNGGVGGGATGGSGQQCTSSAVGTGGTQSGGGSFGGGLGQGGNATTNAGAGGGGGWYGGGASDGSGGGGGSGYTDSPGATATSQDSGVNNGPGKIIITW